MSEVLSRKRDRVDILGDILRSSDSAYWKHRSMMDGRRLQAYSAFLLDHGFMEQVTEDNRVYYRITKKGLELLGQIDSLQDMLDITNSMVAMIESSPSPQGHP